jgi:hypothetical protein
MSDIHAFEHRASYGGGLVSYPAVGSMHAPFMHGRKMGNMGKLYYKTTYYTVCALS